MDISLLFGINTLNKTLIITFRLIFSRKNILVRKFSAVKLLW